MIPKKLNNICQQSSLSNKHDSIVKISMGSINVCGLNSKLKYGILQDHIIIKKMI